MPSIFSINGKKIKREIVNLKNLILYFIYKMKKKKLYKVSKYEFDK